MNRYNYEELRNAAVKNPTADNLNALGEWFQNYGMTFWNGEYFDADGYRLYPVHTDPDEYGDVQIVGYEFR